MLLVTHLHLFPGHIFGLLHFRTFDGWSYTFNGFGEYVLVRSKNLSPVPYMMIQARTEKVDVDGTSFTEAKGVKLR